MTLTQHTGARPEGCSEVRTRGKYAPVRCGWCADGKHDLCAINLEIRPGQLWRCPCACCTPDRTRCTECGRRGVEVTTTCRCIDAEDCRAYCETRYRANRAVQQVLEIRAQAQNGPSPTSEGTSETTRPPGRGVCPCCGVKTRGGRFLPGHDAKWVGQIVARIETTPAQRVELLAVVESVSLALLAKVTRRLGQ